MTFQILPGLPNVLDLVLGNQEMARLVDSCLVSGDVGSDHLPVVTTLVLQTEAVKCKKVNMKLWAKNIDEELIRYKASPDVNSNVDSISGIFAAMREKSLMVFTQRKRALPLEIRQNIRLRN